MNEQAKRQCPNCKTEILVVFKGGALGCGEIKKCPSCKSPILFCPDGYICHSVAPLMKRHDLRRKIL
mgnify:CR=1 FL=1